MARTLSVPVPMGATGDRWQYHPRSDRHSKVACWGILFDLLGACPLLAEQAAKGKVVFGINHEMRDFKMNRRKNLDLVLCTPSGAKKAGARTFRDLVDKYGIILDDSEKRVLDELPAFHEGLVGNVHCAVEAKACMTEHMKARPRLYDELNSSHQTIHGASDMVIAVGFAMVNIAPAFYSPGRPRGERSVHRQPDVARSVIEKLKELPRRSATGQEGFDAFGIAVVSCVNDGVTPVRLVQDPPAPAPQDIFHYGQMIWRIKSAYESRFPRA